MAAPIRTGSDPLAGFTYAHVKLRTFGSPPGRAALKMIDKVRGNARRDKVPLVFDEGCTNVTAVAVGLPAGWGPHAEMCHTG